MTTQEQAPYCTTSHYYDTAHVTVWFTLQHLDIEPEQGVLYCSECFSDSLSWDNYFANVLFANKGRLAVNTSDWISKGYTDVTLSVAISQL